MITPPTIQVSVSALALLKLKIAMTNNIEITFL